MKMAIQNLTALPEELRTHILGLDMASPFYCEIQEPSERFQEIFRKQITSYAEAKGMRVLPFAQLTQLSSEGTRPLCIGSKSEIDSLQPHLPATLLNRCSIISFTPPQNQSGTHREPDSWERFLCHGKEILQNTGILTAPRQKTLGRLEPIYQNLFNPDRIPSSYAYRGAGYTDAQMHIFIAYQIDKNLPSSEGKSANCSAKEALCKIYTHLHRQEGLSPEKIATEIQDIAARGLDNASEIIAYLENKYEKGENDFTYIVNPALTSHTYRMLRQVKAIVKLAWFSFVAFKEGTHDRIASHLHGRFGRQLGLSKMDFQYLIPPALGACLWLTTQITMISKIASALFLGPFFAIAFYASGHALLEKSQSRIS